MLHMIRIRWTAWCLASVIVSCKHVCSGSIAGVADFDADGDVDITVFRCDGSGETWSTTVSPGDPFQFEALEEGCYDVLAEWQIPDSSCEGASTASNLVVACGEDVEVRWVRSGAECGD